MKKKTINERIQEELQYTEELNKKIRKIEQKTYKKKEQSKSKKNNFEFFKEFKYLKEQQRRIENELCIQLYDISNGKDDELMKDYYFTMNFERDVSRDFYKILDIVKQSQSKLKQNNLANKDNSVSLIKQRKSIESSFTTLSTFNQNLIVMTKKDLNNLGITPDQTKDNDESNASTNDIIDLIAKSDCFNILSVSDIDYIISQELYQAELTNSLIFPSNANPLSFSLKSSTKNTIKETLFNLPSVSFSIGKPLEERALISLGDDQGREKLKQINNSFELTIIKHKTDYKKLVSSLINEVVNITKKDIPHQIKLKCANVLFMMRNVDNKLSLNQRLTLDNTPQSDISLYQVYFKFLEQLYSFKAKQKIVISSYSNELNELKATSSKLLYEEINDTLLQRQKDIAQYEFDIRKQEIKTQHMKNREIYDIKQKLREEKKMIDDEIQKQANDKLEAEKKMKDERNKLISENFVKQKKLREDAEKESLKREHELLIQKEREEVNLKLPQIKQRQIRSTEQFITQQKKKEIERNKKELDQQRLNEIVENYKSRPNVESDSERLIAITQSLQNKYESVNMNKMDEGERAKLFSNNGFTVEHLMKDFRYKVSSALFEAGIINKDYGNQLLKEINTIHCSNNNNNNASSL